MNIRKSRKIDAIMGQGPMLIEFYRNNPCIAAYDLLGVDFAPIQRIIFEDMWFKNYVITAISRGGGKSSAVDSLIFTKDNGLCYMYEELPPVPSYLLDGTDEVIDFNIVVHTADGSNNTKRVSLEKNIEGLNIVTKKGFGHKGSHKHPLLTIDREGSLVYKKLSDFSIGDKVCVQRGQNVFGDNNTANTDNAYLLGLMVGDGCYSGTSYGVSFVSSDEDLIVFIKDYCINNNINYGISIDKRRDCLYVVTLYNFYSVLEKFGVKKSLSYNKDVPKIIRSANKEVQISFLQGLFDTDGSADPSKGKSELSSVSLKLIKEVQLMLLNLGIVAKLRKKKTKSKFGKAFILEITSKDGYLFSRDVGFRLKRKQRVLDTYFNNINLNTNIDTIPFVKQLCKDIQLDYYKHNTRGNTYSKLDFSSDNYNNITYNRLSSFIKDVDVLIDIGCIFSNKSLLQLEKIRTLVSYNYYFDEVVSIESWIGDCYDFEMDVVLDTEPNYFANGFISHNTFMQGVLATLSCMLYPGYRVGLVGPSFRQSKMIFAEVEKLYTKSSILVESTEKRPIRGSDVCYLKFKSVGGQNGAYLEALPLGADGAKIRGSRFYLMCVDELAQVPDKIIDMVLRPMGATKQDPMAHVRHLEQKAELIAAGLAIESDFEEETVNKMVMTSSGYYKFNHMYRRMRAYWQKMDECDASGEFCPFSVHQIPHKFLPKGFLDPNNIEEAQRVMSNHEFRMEYEAEMVSDSEGFFKASLLDECTLGSNFYIELRGDRDSKYIIGVDPNQAGSASCGVVIVKVGPINKIVNVMELKKNTTQELTKAVQDICDNYNVIRIFMDKGGGGKAVMDLLEEGYGGKTPIIDRTNDDHRHLQGRHILEMVNFNTAWIADANFATLALLEDRKLLFPQPPVSTIDMEAMRYESVELLKKQMLNIVVTPTAGGALHFDTPKKGQNKDLYSAIILAGYGVRIVEKELEGDGEPILYNASGMVRPRQVGGAWNVLDQNGPAQQFGHKGINMAVLQRKIK